MNAEGEDRAGPVEGATVLRLRVNRRRLLAVSAGGGAILAAPGPLRSLLLPPLDPVIDRLLGGVAYATAPDLTARILRPTDQVRLTFEFPNLQRNGANLEAINGANPSYMRVIFTSQHTTEPAPASPFVMPNNQMGKVMAADPSRLVFQITPAAADFPRAIKTQVGADATRDALGHAVTYDAARGLLYSDVEVNAPSYRPFVRLTLAGFQPVAIAGAYVSNVVNIDPLRLGIDRTVTLEEAEGGIKVTVTGVDHKGILNAAGALGFMNLLRVTWQRADPAISDPELKWTNIGPPLGTLLVRSPGATFTTWSRTNVAFPVTADPLRAIIEEAEPSVKDNAGAPIQTFEVIYTEVIEIPVDWRT